MSGATRAPARALQAITTVLKPGRHRRLLPAALALLALGAAPPARRTGAPPFEESIEVVATSVLVSPAEGLRRFTDHDWRVIENGEVRKVDRVELLGGDTWELLIWVDGPFCDQAALSRTLLGLAHQARKLTAAGDVEVVAAAPEPRVVLPSTRDTSALVDALAKLSRESLCSREADALFWRARGMPPGAPVDTAHATPAGAAAALADLRRLVESRASMLAKKTQTCHATAACALLLVSHGYPLDPDLRLPAELRPDDAPKVAAALVSATDDLAQRLVLGRWLVLALPFAPPSPDGEDESDRPLGKEARPGPAPFPRIGGGDHGPPAMPEIGHRKSPIEPPAAAFDVYVLPEVAPLRRLADFTAGAVLRVPDQIAAALDSLASRRRLWYRTSPFAPGEVRTLEVRVRDRRAEAPAWVGRPP